MFVPAEARKSGGDGGAGGRCLQEVAAEKPPRVGTVDDAGLLF